MSRSSSCSKSTKLYCVKSVSCILGIYYFTANHRLVHIHFTVFHKMLIQAVTRLFQDLKIHLLCPWQVCLSNYVQHI